MRKIRIILYVALLTVFCQVNAQGLPTDGKLTIRPLLQQLGEELLQGKTGSIVAINPANGEILCLATNTPNGSDVRQAIGKPQAPGSTFKTAQALTLLSEGVISPQTTVECVDGVTDGNIKVRCHKHRSPLALKDALAQSCNTWFLMTFASMINDDFMYESKEEAITTWRSYMQSMGLGGPMHIDIEGEQGGLLAGADYLNRRVGRHGSGRCYLHSATVMQFSRHHCQSRLVLCAAHSSRHQERTLSEKASDQGQARGLRSSHRGYAVGCRERYCHQHQDHLSHLWQDWHHRESRGRSFCVYRLCSDGQSEDSHQRLRRAWRIRCRPCRTHGRANH